MREKRVIHIVINNVDNFLSGFVDEKIRRGKMDNAAGKWYT